MPNLQQHAEHLMTRAELYLCLGQAFIPPVQAEYHEAMGEALPADLDELLPDTDAGQQLRNAMRQIDSHETLLRGYSRLFLVPPYPAPLNAGLYIDQAMMGPSVVEMEGYYQRHGLARDVSFRDTPDHLALQLQFLALLLASASQAEDGESATHYLEEARDFLNRFLRPWPNDWVRKLEQEVRDTPHGAPYLLLARLVRDSLDQDARWLQAQVPAPEAEAQEDAPELAEASAAVAASSAGNQTECARCGKPFAASGDLAGMMATLRAKGLDASHLAVCPDCRAGAMGMQHTNPEFKEVKSR
ncbi:TorD/DmsD family molecular chaperone [Alkalilimnicola ehrlichii MLHE-1]|uniref:Cytoplasmic chaperone TorD family protein n=1 Tax=Alkalilimnicola ehrlichii (strain ATCC BAA-1101 / DSM 17681 / MLHE-1) TaxID=187272 RepID=Q0AC69_ALKEH|nr:molecular chaperone TorD family protein [Alkalilimnicola ehrlichii]ABI55568.1 cytoplasmic chaperone TorD family protein [Alkalilimnicola ehrlichii MLHE-1]